jgi:tetratricopeptide (TPR) repeat protein
MAISDYQQAIALDANLADSHLRLGRAEAKSSHAKSGRPWEDRFQRASALRNNNAQVFFDWGEALRAAYEPAKKPDDNEDCFSDAQKHYSAARTFNPHCHTTHLGWGELLLDRAKKQQTQKIDFTKTLQDSIEHFNHAIQCNSQAVDAYRDRGEAYRMLGQFGPAMHSAQKACTLTDYRAPLSLKVLAAVYHDLKESQRAVYYLAKAAEYSSDAQQVEILELYDSYVADLKAVVNAKTSVASNVRTRGLSFSNDGSSTRSLNEKALADRQLDAMIPQIIPRSLSAAPE